MIPKISSSERLLAERLRERGVQFQQQALIGTYSVDFLIQPNFVIECEGKVHTYKQDQDDVRTNQLNLLGYKVIRIANYLIFEDPDGIADLLSLIVRWHRPKQGLTMRMGLTQLFPSESDQQG